MEARAKPAGSEGTEAGVLNGDLVETPLPDVLGRLAGRRASGCLRLTDLAHDRAKVYLRRGRVYSVVVPGAPSRVGAALVASEVLAPADLEDALKVQRTELPDWRLGELLVHLGHVAPHVVEAVSAEVVRNAMQELLCWYGGTWRFQAGEHTRDDVATPVEVADLLAELAGPRARQTPARRVRPQAALEQAPDLLADPEPPGSAASGSTAEAPAGPEGGLRLVVASEDEVVGAISRLSPALSALLGEAPVPPAGPPPDLVPAPEPEPTVDAVLDLAGERARRENDAVSRSGLSAFPGPVSGDADTAALLRELSLLGMDEDSPGDTGGALGLRPPPPRTAPQGGPVAPTRKRKGLFGLG
jgi:Domain of unknown function (DUF4388)